MIVKEAVSNCLLLWFDGAHPDAAEALQRFLAAQQALNNLLDNQLTFAEYSYILRQLGVQDDYWQSCRQNLQDTGLWL